MGKQYEPKATPEDQDEQQRYESKYGGQSTRESNLTSVEELLGIKDEYFEPTPEAFAYQKLVGERVMAKLMGGK